MARCRIWGHRGSPKNAPENTLASLDLALREGSDGIEFDVRLSADGIPVIFHDDTLDRTTNGTGPLQAQTEFTLRRLDAGSWFSSTFRGERIPLLNEVLDLLSRTPAEGILEIKDGRPQAIRSYVDAVVSRRLLDRIYFHSFDPRDLAEVRHLCPRARIQLIGDVQQDLLTPARTLRADALSPYDEHLQAEDISVALLEQARGAGIEVNAGLVNNVGLARALADLGIGAVFTDEPGPLATAARS